jgi:hypothetical protein
MKRYPRWFFIAAAVLAALMAAAAGLHFAGKTLKTQIEQALGEETSVGDISLGLFTVAISDLHIRAPKGWPAEDALRARRIEVTPDWRALLSRRIALRGIRVEGAYLSMWRAPDGRLRLLPSLLEKQQRDAGEPPEIRIGRVALQDARVDFFDSTVRRPAHRVQLAQVNASLDALHLPALDGNSALELTGVVKGVRTHGSFSLQGEVELGSKDSELITTLRGVDLIALQPYLIRAADTGVERGTLDLDLRSTVKQRRLRAPGAVTLHNLELDDAGNFMGMPRQAALVALKDGRDDIRVSFVLEGNLDDPQFSLNESLATRFGAGLADTLGISISTLGKSVGGAAAGVGSALKGLFGK